MDTNSAMEFSNVFDLMARRAAHDGGASAFTYLDDGEHVSAALTFGALAARATDLAAHLQAVAQPGERVLLVYGPCIDYIIGFFACMAAGMVAVPAVPPTNARMLQRLRLIADTEFARTGSTRWPGWRTTPCPQLRRRGVRRRALRRTPPSCSTPPARPERPRACRSAMPTSSPTAA